MADHILVVEDEDRIRNIVLDYFAAHGLDCDLARDGEEALDLLLCLIRNKGQVLSRDQLLDKVWGIDFEGGERAVDVRIKSLRSALGSAGKQIKTIFKVGYRMEGE